MTNCYATGAVSGNYSVGGVAGYINISGSVTNCFSHTAVSGNWHVGGVAGDVSGSVENCYATGAVIGNEYVGGVAGSVTGSVKNCYATGMVGGDVFVGGVAGTVNGRMTNCAALGPSVKGTTYVGGVAGSKTGLATLSGNVAFVGMTCTNNGLSYDNGAAKTTAEIAASGFFEALFGNDPAWTYATCKLPILAGLAGQSVELPFHLQASSTEIYTEADLRALADAVNSGNDYNGKTVTLMNDLTLTGKWVPIGKYVDGTDDKPFKGVFDGNGKKITALYIDDSSLDYAGLFGFVEGGGTVKNLGVVSVNISGGDIVGGVAGYVDGSVENCYVTGAVSGNSTVGGVVGVVFGSVEDCYSTGAVSGNSTVGGNAGGVAGYVSVSMTNCYATGAVSGGNYVGGLAGVVSSGCNVMNCAALNPGVEGASDVGRVAGIDYGGTLADNVAFSGMTCTNIGSNNDNGTSKTATEIAVAGFFEALFVNDSAWTYDTGKLPGLFGASVPMPAHLLPEGGNPFDGGDGSSGSPYLISAPEQLAWLAGQVNEGNARYNNKSYKLTANLDLSAYNTGKGWVSIGSYDAVMYTYYTFRGEFDGGGKTVSELYIGDTTLDYAGLFGSVTGTVKNLGVVNADISGGSFVGGVAGNVVGSVKNCAALSPGVKSAKAVGRVTGYNVDTLTGNRVLSGMACESKGGVGGDLYNDGAPMSISDAIKASFWSGTMGWNTSVWTIANDQLPTLKNVGGSQSGDTGLYLTVKSLTLATVKADDQDYTGSAIEPVEVSFGGVTLTKDVDYTAVYRNNTNVGTDRYRQGQLYGYADHDI